MRARPPATRRPSDERARPAPRPAARPPGPAPVLRRGALSGTAEAAAGRGHSGQRARKCRLVDFREMHSVET